MAQLKDTVVSGSLHATDSLLANILSTISLKIPTTSNGSTYGTGTAGQIVRSNGSSVYWHTLIADDIGALKSQWNTSDSGKFLIINSSGTNITPTAV